MTSVDPLIGRDLDGRYTIIDHVGRGNMGAVYRATQHGLGREVAIKVVTPRLGVDTMVVKRFLREAKLASRLSHPNAVAVLDFGQTGDGLIYLVMELVKGRTLEDIVAADGKLSAPRVVRIGSQICDALEGAHVLQIVHRDLKPANIMVMTAGRDIVKVLDFGLAKSLQPDAASINMTSVGALLGTPAFMPPESVTGGVVDARADLYSLGCTLFFAAMGKLPFESPAIAEMIAMHAMEPPPPLIGVQVGLARVIERLMAKNPADRYADAAATRDALEESLSAGKEVVAGPPRAATTEAPLAKSASKQAAARAAAMDAPLSKGTMLGWATPASGVPITKTRTGEAAPIAKPAVDGGPVVKIRTGEAAALAKPSPTPPGGAPLAKPNPTPPAGAPVANQAPAPGSGAAQQRPAPMPLAQPNPTPSGGALTKPTSTGGPIGTATPSTPGQLAKPTPTPTSGGPIGTATPSTPGPLAKPTPTPTSGGPLPTSGPLPKPTTPSSGGPLSTSGGPIGRPVTPVSGASIVNPPGIASPLTRPTPLKETLERQPPPPGASVSRSASAAVSAIRSAEVAPNTTLRAGDSVPIVMPRTGESVPIEKAPAGSAPVSWPTPVPGKPMRADTEIDPDPMTGAPTLEPGHPIAPMPQQYTAPVAPYSRKMVIAWTVIIVVMLASASVIVYKLITT